MMLNAERKQYILAALERDGKVVASTLTAELGVSEDTIRRDLRELAEVGALQRVHGGALRHSPAATSYTLREQQSPSGKLAIARAAAGLVRDGQVVIMDSGTTTLAVAQQLPASLHATVVTNSPPIAVALAEHPNVEVVIAGGRLYKPSRAVIGAEAAETIRRVRADLLMLGVCSLHPEVGISVPDAEEAYIKRVMVASAGEVVALATGEKLNTAAPYIVGPLAELTYLVTEPAVSEATLAPYRAQGITVICAEKNYQ